MQKTRCITSFQNSMPKHGKVQMILSDFGIFGTTWNTFRTNQEQKKASKVPLSKMTKKMEQWNKALYTIDIHLVILFQKCSKMFQSSKKLICSNVPKF